MTDYRAQERQNKATLVVLYGFLFAYLIFALGPFLWMVITSFKVPSDVFRIPPSLLPSKLVSEDPMGNYVILFTQHDFWLFMRNSLLVATGAAIGQVFTTTLAGYALACLPITGKNGLFACLLVTAFVPVEVTIIPEFLMMRELGLLNSLYALIVPSFLVGTFGTFILKEYFCQLPQEYKQLAYAEGASAWRIFRKIYCPLARPAIIAVFVIAFTNNWNELLRPLLFLNDTERYTLPLGLMNFFSQYEANWTVLMAGSVVSTLPLIIVYALSQRYVLYGFSVGGIKG
ncbi:carbohydrate ABC transporter permease [Vibrio sp. WXL103]|uniref:carbohydrate ABC transporter permease n=1 Tax=Vibrio sp. WXL103 TaxID=3450710 RepID=UPI003EC4D0B8